MAALTGPPCRQEAYESAVEYFGENPKTSPPTMFFPIFVRFVKAYKVKGPQELGGEAAALRPVG